MKCLSSVSLCFRRRKIALIWEVVLLARNAISYNEEDSLIVQHSKIVVQTLLDFIRNPNCSNPMDLYQPDMSTDELNSELTAPEVEFVATVTEDVFSVDAADPTAEMGILSPPINRRAKV